MDTRISIYKLEVFCEVVASGSVTRAAAKLGVAQPVVTAHLRSLESRLGVKLVQRDGRGIALTPAGEIAQRWATEVVNDTRHVETLLEALSGDGAEGLRVTTGINGASNGIAHAVVRFQVEHPEAHLELSVLPTDQAVGAVLARDSDFAVVSYLTGLTLDSALRVQQLGSDELILVAAPQVILDALKPKRRRSGIERWAVTATQLSEIPFVCTPRGTTRRPLIDAAMQERGVTERHIIMEVRSETAFHGAVRDGVGFALLSRRSMVDMLTRGDLVEVEIPGGSIPLGIDLVSRRDLEPRPLHKVFRDAMKAELLNTAPAIL
jgi:LysR family transcriptional regulator, low CO2-responsive transcriptional regulator